MPRRYQRSVIETRVRIRQLTDPRRRLPDFVLIGAQRSGTSSMYKWLESHPWIAASLRKETEYLSYRHDRGEAWYRAHFPSRWQRAGFRLTGRRLLTFEATAYYLFHPWAAERAAALLPDAKLIVLLRNPVERAWSHYHHMRRYDQEPLSFDAALDAEPERLAGEVERMRADPTYVSLAHQRWSYVTRGVYADQLPAWIDRFGADHLLVLRSEDVYEKPDDNYQRVLGFLGLPEHRPAEFRNASTVRVERPPAMPDAVRGRLAEEFEPHNRRLEALLHRDFNWH